MAIGGLLPLTEAVQTVWNGSTLGASYKVYTYQAGTSTEQSTYPTYDDAVAATNANANPTVADSNGRVAMWGSGSTAYKVVVKTDADVTVKTIDDCYIMPGATTLVSKTPSEYQVAFYENVSGSYKLTNAQTENGWDFKYDATGFTIGSNNKMRWRDNTIYIYSSGDGVMDLVSDGRIQFNNSASDTDVEVRWVGTNNTGIQWWMEDEDYWKYMDDLLINSDEKLYFRDTAIHVSSSTDGRLNIVSDTDIKITSPTVDITASTTIGLLSDAVSFGEGTATDIVANFASATNTGVFTWKNTEDYFLFGDDILMSTTEKVQFRDTAIFINSAADGYLDLEGDSGVRIGTGAATGLFFNEIASAKTDIAGYGQVWVKDDAPNRPRFTDDAGSDFWVGISDGTTGGSGSAGAGNQYVELEINGTTYKLLYDT